MHSASFPENPGEHGCHSDTCWLVPYLHCLQTLTPHPRQMTDHPAAQPPPSLSWHQTQKGLCIITRVMQNQTRVRLLALAPANWEILVTSYFFFFFFYVLFLDKNPSLVKSLPRQGSLRITGDPECKRCTVGSVPLASRHRRCPLCLPGVSVRQ